LLPWGTGKTGAAGPLLGREVNHLSTNLGTIGPAAIAAALILVAFGSRPGFVKDLICGVAAPGILAAAGGVWALPVIVLGSFLHSVVS
jgi:hypothetical protein